MKMKQVVSIVMIIVFAMAAANMTQASSLGEELFVAKLEESGVQFIYSTEGLVTLIKTEATAELVDALVADKPLGVNVTVVTYLDKGRGGYELVYEEE